MTTPATNKMTPPLSTGASARASARFRAATSALVMATLGGVATSGCGDAAAGPSGPPPPLRSMGGQARFFDLKSGSIQEVSGEGAEVFVLEDPTQRQILPADGRFRFDRQPEGSEITLALRHADFQSTLTATLTVGTTDATDITFQVLTRSLAHTAGVLLGVDPEDPTFCEMATTVAAVTDSRWDIWAPGEPGATVQVQPDVVGGPKITYFDAHTIPDKRLTETSTDGGAVLAGAPAGTYVWTATKPARSFNQLKMKCVPGWLTNASPPWGLQATAVP